jgi:hypothetical protein
MVDNSKHALNRQDSFDDSTSMRSNFNSVFKSFDRGIRFENKILKELSLLKRKDSFDSVNEIDNSTKNALFDTEKKSSIDSKSFSLVKKPSVKSDGSSSQEGSLTLNEQCQKDANRNSVFLKKSEINHKFFEHGSTYTDENFQKLLVCIESILVFNF